MKRIQLTAAQRYEVQPDYQRFDQKMNLTRRGLWDQASYAPTSQMVTARTRLAQAGKPGYGLLDWGFANAAQAGQTIAGFSVNRPHHGPTSWAPLGPPPPGGMKWSGDAAANTRALKAVACLFGAGDVGITLLDRRWVYGRWFDEETGESYPIRFSDEPGLEHISRPSQLDDHTQVIPASMKYVAVFVLPMDRRGIGTAPALTQLASTGVTYSTIGQLVLSVAEFIRGLGYHAIPSSNCTALNVPLAIDAGLGELGRHAKLIHPVWGPVCRLCKVITDLPLEPDPPIATGATTFCESCGKCADACPARAIPRGPRSLEPAGDFGSAGVRQWQVDHRKCFEFWLRVGTNCGICLAVCPFNKGPHWVHQVSKGLIARFPVLDPLFVTLDDVLGYGKTRPGGFWEGIG